MMGLKKATLIVTLVLISCYIEHAYGAKSLVLGGKVRDQAPDTMAHKKFPRNYWIYDGWTDNPDDGNCGTANGGNGWPGTDFELPLYTYGTKRSPDPAINAGGKLYNGEMGLVGPCCNRTNRWQNCAQLLPDKTPAYAHAANSPFWTVNSPDSFWSWFHDNPKVATVPYNLTLPSQGGRLYGYSGEFFPIDGKGWGDSNKGGLNNNVQHNFAFCFEVHGHFSYQGGEIFRFTGDDDLWVYLNSKLVIDLGGIHTALSAQVNVDDMGLTLGSNYRFDLFYCERHTTLSNLQLTTSIEIACTYYDWCDICEGDGQSCCTAQDLRDCDDDNACTTDTCAVLVPPLTGCQNIDITPTCPSNKCYAAGCDRTKGCIQTPRAPCDDGKKCTIDTCNNATGCVFTAIPLTCGDACNTASCSEATGTCVTTPIPCDDGDACTNDKCDRVNGCQHTKITCPTDACVTTTCHPTLQCQNVSRNCDDQDPCTDDSCDPISGCKNVPKPCGDPTNQCRIYSCNPQQLCHYVNRTCDDKDPCTIDSCDPKSGCQFVANTCDDGDACTDDSCDSALGGCQHPPRVCDDKNLCTSNTCDSKSGCVFPTLPCDDGDACTNDVCTPTGGCTHPAKVCDDGDMCTNNTCDKINGCQYPIIPCTDNSPCTNDHCEPLTGCKHDPLPPGSCDQCSFTNGSYIICEYTDKCNPVECDPTSGQCSKITPVVCNDDNMCTDDSCVSSTGECSFVKITCNDGNLCTDDSCAAETGCVFTNKTCDDHNPCTIDSCSGGVCSNVPVAGNCVACAALPCTWTDSCNPKSCVNDQCVATPTDCNDNNPCTKDTCDNSTATAQCLHESKVCDNSNLCEPQQCNTTTGSCDRFPKNCNDGNLCTEDICGVIAGVATCSNKYTVCVESTACSPQLCNEDTGSCEAEVEFDCDDRNACTIDTCVNTLSGQANCTYSLVDCSGFDTGDMCTPATCDAAVGCVPGVSICNDGNICTDDVCVGPMQCNFTDGNYCDDGDFCTDDVCDGSKPTLETACSYTNHTCYASSICMNVTGCNATTGCIEQPVSCNASADWCQVPKCDEVAFCIQIPRTCIVDDPDCFYGQCDSIGQKCITNPLPDWTTITTQKGNGVTCYAFYNKAQTAAIITGGVVAGIVVGAVVFAAAAAVAARKAYLYMQLKQGNMGAAQANPLYEASGVGGENPLFGT